jgi:glucose uptake protein GlcU
MKFGKISLGVAAAVALAAAPTLAQAAFAPAVAPMNGEESELNETGSIIVGVLAVAAIVLGVVATSDGNDNEIPVSN